MPRILLACEVGRGKELCGAGLPHGRRHAFISRLFIHHGKIEIGGIEWFRLFRGVEDCPGT